MNVQLKPVILNLSNVFSNWQIINCLNSFPVYVRRGICRNSFSLQRCCWLSSHSIVPRNFHKIRNANSWKSQPSSPTLTDPGWMWKGGVTINPGRPVFADWLSCWVSESGYFGRHGAEKQWCTSAASPRSEKQNLRHDLRLCVVGRRMRGAVVFLVILRNKRQQRFALQNKIHQRQAFF